MTTEAKYRKNIATLNQIGIALSGEEDKTILLKKILTGAMKLTHADGGTLYLTHKDKLSFSIIANNTLGIPPSHVLETNLPLISIPLFVKNEPNKTNIATYCYHENKTVHVADAYCTKKFDFSGMRKVDEKLGYQSKSFLVIPLRNHEKKILGVLQLINAKNEKTGEIISFDKEHIVLAESVASQAAIILTKFELILAQKKLFESLLRLIAHAIDEKSKHTSNHCTRVPIITKMIAEAVNRSHPDQDRLHLTNHEIDELMIAAWLHDCGKIVTPDHVVNKSTKLETIVDRIEIINTRFEILKRDAKISMLEKNVAADTSIIERNEKEYQQRIDTLNEAQAFLNKVNIGGEKLSAADINKIELLGTENTYQCDQSLVPLLSAEEIINLSIVKGTLNNEERQIIQNHVKVTAEMLRALPYPADMKLVPDIAGAHHERIDGKGYPYGIQGNEILIQARILAIADIFEALTSPDRPYKTAKPLTEVLSIMENMKSAGHIDPDLYEVFISEKVYLQFARQYLSAGQIDVT